MVAGGSEPSLRCRGCVEDACGLSGRHLSGADGPTLTGFGSVSAKWHEFGRMSYLLGKSAPAPKLVWLQLRAPCMQGVQATTSILPTPQPLHVLVPSAYHAG